MGEIVIDRLQKGAYTHLVHRDFLAEKIITTHEKPHLVVEMTGNLNCRHVEDKRPRRGRIRLCTMRYLVGRSKAGET